MRLYSTLQRDRVELPEPPGPIRMYFCGPTVYARAHIGNARPFVLGMWLRSWLRERGYDVTLVHNITDVNDKIYDAAPGASAELAERATQWYLQDTGDLGLGRPDELPKATEHVPGIVRFIEELVERGHAYPAGGDVYFRVASFPDYGALSGRLDADSARNPSEEEEQTELKEDGRDFALWKATKDGEDTSWESPWGRGRPGWHIECSAMAEELLGERFEIHGGGLDLVFPHHENELAQSRALGHEFAQIWTHNGMLRFTGEKMSKSLGNVVTIREAIDRWGRETVLLFFLTAHWSKPIDFSDETMAQAAAQWKRLSEVTIDHNEAQSQGPTWRQFAAVLDDDFNTPAALAVINEWHRVGNGEALTRSLALFGLPRPAHHHRITLTATVKVESTVIATVVKSPSRLSRISDLIGRRFQARRDRDYTRSDELRDEIKEEGVKIEDTADGVRVVVPEE